MEMSDMKKYNFLKNRIKKIKDMSSSELNKTVKFPVGPKKMADLRKLDVLWFVLTDQIYHRGQLSIYIRLAGGKMPSIYRPSADKPW